MMLGEIVFDNFFKDGHLRYPIPTYFFFISFIGLVCLIIMNLLVSLFSKGKHQYFDIIYFPCQLYTLFNGFKVGLAVDDIKSVKEQANLKRLAMQVSSSLKQFYF